MNKTIFIADDEKEIRNLVKTFLEQDGFLVQTFPDGDKLMAALDSASPDLVILDVLMPGTDGLSICSFLRKNFPSSPSSLFP